MRSHSKDLLQAKKLISEKDLKEVENSRGRQDGREHSLIGGKTKENDRKKHKTERKKADLKEVKFQTRNIRIAGLYSRDSPVSCLSRAE